MAGQARAGLGIVRMRLAGVTSQAARATGPRGHKGRGATGPRGRGALRGPGLRWKAHVWESRPVMGSAAHM